jgi:hypothetical protein
MDKEALVEAINGGVGSATSKLTLYPFDLLKTRMAKQADGKTLIETIQDILQKDGIHGLYKGSGPKIFKSVTGKVLYFYLYRILSNLAAQMEGSSISTLSMKSNLIVGFFSEVCELPVIMPLEAIATKSQVAKKGESFIDIAKMLYTENKLFVSLDAYVLGALQPAFQMTIFDQIKRRMARPLSTLESFMLGVLASSFAITVTYPLDLARTQNQTAEKGKHPEGFFTVWARIIQNNGFLALFSGLSASLIQGVLSAALMLAVKERITSFNRRLFLGVKGE